ncbi:MAG: LysR family transcriptional regulator [Uliginosibacterium sp.]|nr:LysR family transcriptional regulator [Uliginosibacterium sp.]
MHEEKLLGLDLDLLVALDVMLETGSVSRTAARLHRSQPAVSRMLGRLRDLFGDPLFVPQGRGLTPTPRALAMRGPLKLTLEMCASWSVRPALSTRQTMRLTSGSSVRTTPPQR